MRLGRIISTGEDIDSSEVQNNFQAYCTDDKTFLWLISPQDKKDVGYSGIKIECKDPSIDSDRQDLIAGPSIQLFTNNTTLEETYTEFSTFESLPVPAEELYLSRYKYIGEESIAVSGANYSTNLQNKQISKNTILYCVPQIINEETTYVWDLFAPAFSNVNSYQGRTLNLFQGNYGGQIITYGINNLMSHNLYTEPNGVATHLMYDKEGKEMAIISSDNTGKGLGGSISLLNGGKNTNIPVEKSPHQASVFIYSDPEKGGVIRLFNPTTGKYSEITSEGITKY